jgi:hypothetical protein
VVVSIERTFLVAEMFIRWVMKRKGLRISTQPENSAVFHSFSTIRLILCWKSWLVTRLLDMLETGTLRIYCEIMLLVEVVW